MAILLDLPLNRLVNFSPLKRPTPTEGNKMTEPSQSLQYWNKMTSKQKLEMLTDILSQAACDISLRDRCLASAESAKAVFAELKPNVIFPEEFRVQFAPEHETAKTTNTLLLKIPPYFGQDAIAPPIEADQYMLCTYNLWDDDEPAAASRRPVTETSRH